MGLLSWLGWLILLVIKWKSVAVKQRDWERLSGMQGILWITEDSDSGGIKVYHKIKNSDHLSSWL